MPIAEMRGQRRFTSLVQIERAASLIVDNTRIAEIFAHEIGGFPVGEIGLSGKRFLRIEAQQVLIAPRLIVQKAAEGMHEPGGRSQTGGHILIRLAQLAQPIN